MRRVLLNLMVGQGCHQLDLSRFPLAGSAERRSTLTESVLRQKLPNVKVKPVIWSAKLEAESF